MGEKVRKKIHLFSIIIIEIIIFIQIVLITPIKVKADYAALFCPDDFETYGASFLDVPICYQSNSKYCSDETGNGSTTVLYSETLGINRAACATSITKEQCDQHFNPPCGSGNRLLLPVASSFNEARASGYAVAGTRNYCHTGDLYIGAGVLERAWCYEPGEEISGTGCYASGNDTNGDGVITQDEAKIDPYGTGSCKNVTDPGDDPGGDDPDKPYTVPEDLSIDKKCDTYKDSDYQGSFQSCKDCITEGNVWTEVGCINGSQYGTTVAILRIAIGIITGIAVLRIVQAGIMYGSGDPEKIKEARAIAIAAVSAIIFLGLCVILIKFAGVDLLKFNEVDVSY